MKTIILNMKKPQKITISMIFFIFITSVSCNNMKIRSEKSDISGYRDSLGQSFQSASDIPVGCSVELHELNTIQKYKDLIEYHFDSYSDNIGTEWIWIGENQYNWEEEDAYIDFAESNNAFISGHTLVWAYGKPEWLNSYEGDTEDWKKLLKSYIQALVGRYKGRVHIYDVVNEAFNDDGTFVKSLWYEKIGPDYINLAFQWAHEADPDVELYLADFNLTAGAGYNKKLDSIIKFISESLQEGIPIHGISFQTHITDYWPSMDEINDALERVSRIDIDIRVSELDISMNYEELYSEFSSERAQLQKDRYYNVVKAFYEYPRIKCITVWFVSDKYSWIPRYVRSPEWPCLFDGNFDPKPAAEGFLNGLKTERSIPK